MKTTSLLSIGIVIGISISCMAAQADALSNWKWRYPLPQGMGLNGVASGNNINVAVGNFGTILVSTNGTNWVAQKYGGFNVFSSVAFGNGLFVAVAGYTPSYPLGYAGTLFVSTNGLNWSSTNLSPVNGTALVAYGNGRFAVLQQDILFGKVTGWVSTEAVTWSHGDSTNMTRLLRAMAFGNGRFVAVGDGTGVGGGGPLGAGVSAFSTDGTNWFQTPATNKLWDVIFVDNLFYAAGPSGVYLSADGVTWTNATMSLPADSKLTAISHGGNRFIAQGSYFTSSPYSFHLLELVSTNGLDWTTNAPPNGGITRDLCFTGDKFLAVGDAGWMARSTDGLDWVDSISMPIAGLHDVAGNQGTYVAVGGDSANVWNPRRVVLVSSNGQDWIPCIVTNASWLSSITYGAGQFLAVGDGGTVLRSADALAWNEGIAGTTQILSSVTYAAGKFVAVGVNGTIVVSTNGVNWSTKDSGITRWLDDVTYGAGLYVAVGQYGDITTSPDADTWTPRNSGTSSSLNAVAYGNGRFVAVGNTNLWSYDGVAWFPGFSLEPPNSLFSTRFQVTFVNGQFFSVGGYYGYVSTDGTNWNFRELPRVDPFRGIAYCNGTLLIVGDGGAIAQSDNFAIPILNGEKNTNGFQLNITGEIGRAYRIQGTTDFADWSDLYTYTNTQTTTSFIDTGMTNHPLRFYRAVSP